MNKKIQKNLLPVKTAVLAGFTGIVSIIYLSSFSIHKKNDDINSVTVMWMYPINTYSENGVTKIYKAIDTVHIYYYKNYVLYKLQAVRQLETDQAIANSNPYFLFKKGDSTGWLFKSLAEKDKPVRLPVDSLLHNRAMSGFKVMPPDNSLTNKFIINDSAGDKLLAKYSPKLKKKETTMDSIYLYFDKNITGINYSLGEALDSQYNMKLYKIRLLYNEYMSPSQHRKIPKREFYFELRQNPLADPGSMKTAFQQFIEHSK